MLVKSQSAKLYCGYIYSDAGYGESTTDLVFAGDNMIAEKRHDFWQEVKDLTTNVYIPSLIWKDL